MLRVFTLTALGILIAAACAGCGKPGESTPQPVVASSPPIVTWPATQRTDGGSFAVTVRPSTVPITRSEHFSLAVTVETGVGSEENPAAALKVAVDADMPAHRHGMNTQPELVAEGDHGYRADGMLFHMAGDWVITVDITTADGVEHAVFPVHVE